MLVASGFRRIRGVLKIGIISRRSISWSKSGDDAEIGELNSRLRKFDVVDEAPAVNNSTASQL